jgi:hypothetical protein
MDGGAMQHAISDPIRSHQFEQFQEKCEAVFRPELLQLRYFRTGRRCRNSGVQIFLKARGLAVAQQLDQAVEREHHHGADQPGDRPSRRS